MSLRVLHIASGDLWGGAEAQLDSLVRASQLLDVQIAVLLLNVRSELGRRLRERDVQLVELDESQQGPILLLREILRHARRLRPHVIHTHRFKENILGGLVARSLGVASVRTAHGAPEPELMTASVRRRVLDWLDGFAARRLQHAVVAVSADLAALLRRHLPGARIHIIPNGVDARELQSLASSAYAPARDQAVFRIGYFGRLVPVKRLDLLLQTAAVLQGCSPRPFEVIIAGEGPQLAMLREMADALGLAGRVKFVGFQSNAASWIATMDCVVLTSDHEGLPMIVLESLALGVPMLSRAVGGIPEVLQAVDASWLVRSAAPEDFAKHVVELMSRQNPPHTPASLLPERYSAAAMARSYLDLYAGMTTVDGLDAAGAR